MSKGLDLWARYIDPACFDTSRGKSIAEELAESGWGTQPAENDRINGWSRVRSALAWQDPDGRTFEPELQVFSNCKNLIRTLPAQVYDKNRPEDLDTDGEDHAPDTLRYGLMAVTPRYAIAPPEAMEDEYAEAQRRLRHGGRGTGIGTLNDNG